MLWWFAETTLVAGLLACVAALLGRLPTIGPTTRHIFWLVVLIKLVTPPVVKSPWPVHVPDRWWAGEDQRLMQDSQRIEETLPPLPERTVSPPPPRTSQGLGSPPVLVQVTTTSSGLVPSAATSTLEIEAKDPPRHDWIVWRPDAARVRQWVLFGWSMGALALALAQLSRIIRFRSRLREAMPAPDWLVDLAEQVGARLEIQLPEILAVPHLATPMLWCLGRPKLLVPCRLIKSIEAARWQGILAHELAHLCRGDHWVGRLELIAGLIWWWNPLYWLTRRRLDAEAELACDAWVVWALPDERLSYAEVLFQICSEFSRAGSPAPALGVAGSGGFFERRLTMILRDRVSCRVSPLFLLAACLMALLALPSWTIARPTTLIVPDQKQPAVRDLSSDDPPASQIREKEGDDDDDDAMDDDDDGDDDDDQKSAEKHRGRDSKSKERSRGEDADPSGIEKQIEGALGPDFEKKIEEWAEKFAKEIEAKFGENSEFIKKMEALGKEMEQKFGENSEFVKKMEALGKDMEKKFGPGSEFEKKIKEKYGPGSEFEKKMKALGEEMEKKFGPGSDFEKKIKEKVGSKLEKAKNKPLKHEGEAAERARARDQRREERIKALESRIEALMKELKALKEAGDKDEDGER
jgi:beta-lactamase regulating signal transducer with metallopeptidase domain